MFFLILSLALYFVPALLASSRHHPRASAIALTNLFLGWTILGWVGCLVWALTEPPSFPASPTYLPPSVFAANVAYPAGWSAVTATELRCRACQRPIMPSATFCTMCGANQTLRSQPPAGTSAGTAQPGLDPAASPPTAMLP